MARLEISGLCKGWDFPVIDRMDLVVEEGEFFVIVGPSGIGKTTLLRLIAGLEQPDAGTIRIGDADITRLPPYRRPVAMTFESYALYPHMTVFENIASALRARGRDKSAIDRTVHDVARLLHIEELLDRRPGEISGGQKQRTALGRTLVAEPEAFLLDEPISHLDARIRHELREQFHLLEELRRVATLYVTHDYSEALSLGDRIGVMGAGNLVQVGTAREVFETPRTLFVAQHLGQPAINAVPAGLAAVDGALRAHAEAGTFAFTVHHGHVEHVAGAAAGIVAGIRPQHIQVVEGDAHGECVNARVEIYEALGATGVLVVDAGGVSLTVTTPPESSFEPGQPVRLALDAASFLYFDRASGRNLMV